MTTKLNEIFERLQKSHPMNSYQSNKTLALFHQYADSYIINLYPGLDWDSLPDLVSPWNEGLKNDMTPAMIKVLAIRCCKKLLSKVKKGY